MCGVCVCVGECDLAYFSNIGIALQKNIYNDSSIKRINLFESCWPAGKKLSSILYFYRKSGASVFT